MSLKSFHIIFITLSTLLCLLGAGWFLFQASQEPGMLCMGALCLIAGISLPIYGVRFYQKIKNKELG